MLIHDFFEVSSREVVCRVCMRGVNIILVVFVVSFHVLAARQYCLAYGHRVYRGSTFHSSGSALKIGLLRHLAILNSLG